MLLAWVDAERPAVLAPAALRAAGPSTPDAATRNEPPRAAEGPTADLSEKRRADERERSFDIADDERRLDSKDAIAGALKRCVSPRVGASTFDVIHAIDFDHETLRGSVEVRDEATEQRNLAAKHHAELPPANAIPEQRLGGGG
jgi:hypothetical protein